MRNCENPECRKPSQMQCPTCTKMQLEPTYYCSQDCFKAHWNLHKLVHTKRDEIIESSFKFTGSLRPYPYSFTGQRPVPQRIKRPDYALTGNPGATQLGRIVQQFQIPVHTKEQIKRICLLYTSPSPRDKRQSRMPSSA